jgi:protein SCO1
MLGIVGFFNTALMDMAQRNKEPENFKRRQFVHHLSHLLWLTPFASSPVSAGVAVVDGVVNGHGLIDPPLLAPDFAVTDSNGESSQFHALLRGHVTAIQLIFTDCSNVCPIQGAIFRQAQDLIPEKHKPYIQLLSLSINPLNDKPPKLKAWLEKFSPKAGWIAVRPPFNAIDRIRAVFNQGRSDLSSHLTEVHIVNPRCELVWRSAPLPSAESIANKLIALS